MCHYLLHYLWVQSSVSMCCSPSLNCSFLFSLHLLIELPTQTSLAVPSHNHIVIDTSAVCVLLREKLWGFGIRNKKLNPNVLITAPHCKQKTSGGCLCVQLLEKDEKATRQKKVRGKWLRKCNDEERWQTAGARLPHRMCRCCDFLFFYLHHMSGHIWRDAALW